MNKHNHLIIILLILLKGTFSSSQIRFCNYILDLISLLLNNFINIKVTNTDILM